MPLYLGVPAWAPNAQVVARTLTAGGANLDLLSSDSSDRAVVGENTDCGGVQIRVKTSSTAQFFVNNVEQARVGTAGVWMTNNRKIQGRNAADSADLDILHLDASDNVYLASSSSQAYVRGSAVLVEASNTGCAIFAGGVLNTTFSTSGGSAPQLGFYGTAAAAKQTVTGSRGGNAALASALTALATIGLITDSSTA